MCVCVCLLIAVVLEIDHSTHEFRSALAHAILRAMPRHILLNGKSLAKQPESVAESEAVVGYFREYLTRAAGFQLRATARAVAIRRECLRNVRAVRLLTCHPPCNLAFFRAFRKERNVS